MFDFFTTDTGIYSSVFAAVLAVIWLVVKVIRQGIRLRSYDFRLNQLLTALEKQHILNENFYTQLRRSNELSFKLLDGQDKLVTIIETKLARLEAASMTTDEQLPVPSQVVETVLNTTSHETD